MAGSASSNRILSHGQAFEKSHSRGPVAERQRDLYLPSIVLDRRSPNPLHQQMRRQIAAAIRTCRPGVRLPSSRTLARLLGVSRNTVLAAYDDLVADGLLHGRRGAGMVVAAGNQAISGFDPRRVMRDAQYPARTLSFVDQDGTPFYVTY
jgi:DNA-binding GntR family transcriptional regulator